LFKNPSCACSYHDITPSRHSYPSKYKSLLVLQDTKKKIVI
jgi:hypothetical protein